MLGRKPENLLTRFWAKVDDSAGPAGCWPWTGARTGAGYGAILTAMLPTGPRMDLAHRIAYELFHREPIPAGMTIDHLCRVRHCVNPRHLDVVSRGENVLRGNGPAAQNARATVCVAGHDLTPANTYVTRRGSRHCLTCHRRRNRAYMRRYALAKRA